MSEDPMPAEAVELERLLLRLREQNMMSLDLEMYERWGTSDPADVDRRATEMGYVPGERGRIVQALTDRVCALRASSPRAIERWADAHVALLDDFVRRTEGDGQGSAGTGRFVAGQEREQWLEVRRGARAYVEENTVYVHVDQALHEVLFGKL